MTFLFQLSTLNFQLLSLRSLLFPLSSFPLVLLAGCTTVVVVVGVRATNRALIPSRIVVRREARLRRILVRLGAISLTTAIGANTRTRRGVAVRVAARTARALHFALHMQVSLRLARSPQFGGYLITQSLAILANASTAADRTRLVALKIGMVICSLAIAQITCAFAVAMYTSDDRGCMAITILVKDIVCLTHRSRSGNLIADNSPRIIGLASTHRTRIAEELIQFRHAIVRTTRYRSSGHSHIARGDSGCDLNHLAKRREPLTLARRRLLRCLSGGMT